MSSCASSRVSHYYLVFYPPFPGSSKSQIFQKFDLKAPLTMSSCASSCVSHYHPSLPGSSCKTLLPLVTRMVTEASIGRSLKALPTFSLLLIGLGLQDASGTCANVYVQTYVCKPICSNIFVQIYLCKRICSNGFASAPGTGRMEDARSGSVESARKSQLFWTGCRLAIVLVTTQ